MKLLENIPESVFRWKALVASVGVIAVCAVVGFHVMFGSNGWMAYRQKKIEYQQLQQEVKDLQQDNQRVEKHINDLKTNPQAIEKVAREQLHYVKPGERVYMLPDQQPAQPQAPAQAKK